MTALLDCILFRVFFKLLEESSTQAGGPFKELQEGTEQSAVWQSSHMQQHQMQLLCTRCWKAGHGADQHWHRADLDDALRAAHCNGTLKTASIQDWV